jgi:type I restriction enzyme R subunit
MFATSSIPNAVKYKRHIEKYFTEITKQNKYERFKDAPIYIVYSDTQDQPSCNSMNNGITEKQVMQNFKLCKNGVIIVVDKLQTGFDETKLHTLFLDKEIRGINAIQTISRVNRTMKYKNDCKIIDFSYKNVNVKNIKQAFEHFSNVVVSDFNPLEDEAKLENFYKEMRTDELYLKHIFAFTNHQNGNKDVDSIIAMENDFVDFIQKNKKEAAKLKATVNNYFRILNLIEFVIEIDIKFSEKVFLEFWRKFNIEYNQINNSGEVIDDVEIYFDNKIGIIAPKEYQDKNKSRGGVTGAPSSEYGDGKFKYNILKVIKKRNLEEEEIAQLIQEFETQIDTFFDYILNDDKGKRLIAKIKDEGSAFTQDEIYDDFSKLYRTYTIKTKTLSDFFKRETKDNLTQLCDDFERSLNVPEVSILS